MRLLSLKLKDFQCHKGTVLEFSPTITTIVGPTDSGKSAILRALRWVCLNDIPGEEFIREGQKKTRVVLLLQDQDEDYKIYRSKGGVINTYELEGDEYKAFGQSVPSDIAALLRLNEINFQGQHDSPFWFSETAGEVSRRLNAVVDLSVIDSTLSNIAAGVRQAMERKTFVEERLEEAKKELESLGEQRTRIEDFGNLKEIYDKLTAVEKDWSGLESFIEDIRSYRIRARESEAKANEGGALLVITEKGLGFYNQWDSLRRLLQSALRDQSEAKRPPDFDLVEKAFDEWEGLKEQKDTLERLFNRTVGAFGLAASSFKRAKIAEERFHRETKGKQCPLCGQIIRT